MKNVIISGTARGSGSDKFRWVSGLSQEAKQALKSKSALVVCERDFNDRLGNWYVVTENRGRYGHRLPNASEAQLIKGSGL